MLRQIVGVVFYTMLFVAFLFAPAGTLDWWRGWVFIVVLFVVGLVSTVGLYRVNRDLLVERSKLPVQPGQPLADKVLLLSFMASYAALVSFITLDVFRFHLMPGPGPVVAWLGLGLYLAGSWMVFVALRTNAFAAAVVRHQTERHHAVVDTGVYSYVRHPMYAGLAPLVVGMCLWLGSYAAALAALVPLGILAARIVLEERFLRRELEGYDEYTRRVRYRLIPGVW